MGGRRFVDVLPPLDGEFNMFGVILKTILQML